MKFNRVSRVGHAERSFCAGSVSGGLAAGFMILFSLVNTLQAQTDPTAAQIAAAWAVFAGGAEGKVVYNTGGEMWAMNLKTGQAAKLMNFIQGAVTGDVSHGWGPVSAYCISPDGSRIAAQNPTGVIVCNIDGSGTKIIWQGQVVQDMMDLGWDGNDKVVYSRNWQIASTAINADNSAGVTVILWDHAAGNDPVAGGAGYASVNKCGDFLSFNIVRSTNCAHAPIIVKLSTQEAKDANIDTTGKCRDGCVCRQWMDSLGTICFHQGSHHDSTYLWRWGVGRIGELLQPSYCGMGGENWSYNTDYMIEVGDNNLMFDSTCIRKAYIRKTKTPGEILYLGSHFYWPDLWVGATAASIKSGDGNGRGLSAASALSVRIKRSTLTVRTRAGTAIKNLRLLDLGGRLVVAASGASGQYTMSIPCAGIYLLAWQESGCVRSRYITAAP
ncbi:MAG: hypothetical protein PHC61_06280 [Chitinivibrionales bacterium]|nr:hypothetical protein [Chitinivibrionales bacterium]